LERDPEVSRQTGRVARKLARGDADDLELLAADEDLALQDIGRAAELSLPVRVAHHDHRIVLVLLMEHAADRRLHAKHVEVVRGCDPAVDSGGAA
jgi:hypothetical protein